MKRFIWLLAAALWIGGRGMAIAQPVINGVNNNSSYTDTATFNVPSATGYDYEVLLNGESVPTDTPIQINRPDYHLIEAWRTNQTSQAVESARLQFIIRASERGSSETGLPPWVPYPAIPSAHDEFQGGQLRLLMPRAFPLGRRIPVVAWVVDADTHALRVNGSLQADGHPAIGIKRGVGSGFLADNHAAGPLNYTPRIGGLETNRTVDIETATEWTDASGVLIGGGDWPVQSRIQVTGGLTVPAGATLTVGAGSIIRLGGGIDITNNGTILIEGSVEEPVVFMPADDAQPWGGFIMRAGTGEIIATGTIFTGSGANPNWFGANGNPGSHRVEQALFYVDDDQSVTLTDCAAVYLAGQLGHARNGGQFNFTRFLNQRCTTGGEYTGADFIVNDSAFIEFPDDSATFVDGDNDGLYLVSGTHGFTNTVIGWTKDDGIDSGGGGAGIFNYQNCWFEANFHEGNSLSGVGKDVRHYDGVFFNNGQGLEDGYDAPTGSVIRCFATGNLTGARFGDNYDWDYDGFLRVQDSILIYNYRDVWGMNWDDWTYRSGQMEVENNYFTEPNPMHPDNEVWNPETDGWRLAPYRGTSPGLVGLGLAIRERQFGLSEVNQPIAVGLSTVATNEVRVDYRVADLAGGLLDQGTVTFAAGKLIQTLQPSVTGLNGQEWLRLTLVNPVGAELTGETHAYYLAGETNAEPPSTELVAAASAWRYFVTPSAPAADWTATDFDDSGWPSGPAELGYGESDQTTTIGFGPNSNDKYTTTYFRHDFNVTDPAEFDTLDLWLKRDDGGVVYVNGAEVFRSPNMPGGPVDYDTRTLSPNGENTIDTASFGADVLLPGANVVAVEIHQADPDSSDLSFDLALTGVAPPSSPELHWAWLAGELVLWWSDDSFILQRAFDLSGPWNPLVGASSPWTPSAAAAEATAFYRLARP